MVRMNLNNQDGAKSTESEAKNQECANQLGRSRAAGKEAPSGEDDAKSSDANGQAIE